MMALTWYILIGAIWPSVTEGPPVYFAASGAEIVVPVAVADGAQLVLRAFADVVGEPLTVEAGSVRVTGPGVRVRTTLDLARRAMPTAPLARLVTYPSGTPPWPPDELELLTCAAPAWFSQWAAAVGVAHRDFSTVAAVRYSERGPADHQLIVIGPAESLATPQEALALGEICHANVLALDPAWSGVIDPVVSAPRLALRESPLAELQRWDWRELPQFVCRRQPEMIWMNRTAVACDATHVWVEVYALADRARVVVTSYLPWDQHLGQDDATDGFFTALLAAAARSSPPALAGALAIHGDDAQGPDPQCPVLSRARRIPSRSVQRPAVQVVDLRGAGRSPLSAGEIQSLLDSGKRAPLLILGDDAVLRAVRGLPEPGLPRNQPGDVVWLNHASDEPTQSDNENLLRLMTAYGVAISPRRETE